MDSVGGTGSLFVITETAITDENTYFYFQKLCNSLIVLIPGQFGPGIVQRLPTMRKLCFVFFLFSCFSAYAQTTGISFQEKTFAAAQAKAKQQGKKVFVEIFLNGCPHCEAIEPILKDPQAGVFYNAQFVSLRLEANSPESKKLQKEKKLTYPEFPLFLFFGNDGRLLHVATPAEKKTDKEFVEEVISVGKTALDPQQATSAYSGRFAAGDRDFGFLIQYGKYAKAIQDSAAQNRIDAAFGQLLVTPQQRLDAVGMYALRRLVTRFDNPLSVYFFSHLADYQSKFPKEEVKEAVESIAFQSLYGSGAKAYSSADIGTLREGMVRVGTPPREAASRTLLKELEACFREKNTPKAVEIFDTYRTTGKTETADYAFLIRYFNEHAPDDRYLESLSAWSGSALNGLTVQASNAQAVCDLYYALAVGFQRKGDALATRQWAAKGKEAATRFHLDISRFVPFSR